MTLIKAGIPQGGNLPSILFNIYALHQSVIQDTLVADYADDKAIISIYENPLIATPNV